VLVLIALAEALGTAPVLAELELVQEVAVLELVAEPLAIGQAAARARVIVRGAEPVLVIALAEVLVLGIVLAKVALLIALAEVLELAIVLAEALVLAIVPAEVRQPETVQVEAVPVRSHLRARLAVPLRIKSVTGPRHHDQVLLLTVEDLAVEVVETTRDPAVTEAATVWAAADTAAVVAGAMVVAG